VRRRGTAGAALAAALAAALSACAGPQRPPAADASRAPPFPLGSPEPHAEPDLVGATHVVQRGETVYRIARTYGIDPRELMEANGISDPRQLATGLELFVPGAPRPLDVPPLAGGPAAGAGGPGGGAPPGGSPAAAAPGAAPPEDGGAPSRWSGRMRWPLKGLLYRGFGVRQGQRHDGIDISAPEGTAVLAAAEGEVVFTGRQQGYGVLVIVRHEGSLVTLYAHNSAVLVKEGERVSAGTPIARVGQSGRTTGPHLHFEVREQVRDGYRPRNPLLYLPP
jgi:murein DD-endopeptidase MepM/ murein hydrolase activator NlpD